MLITKNQFSKISDATFESYIVQLQKKLEREPFQKSLMYWFPFKYGINDLHKLIIQIVKKVENYGFLYEDDVTPLVILHFMMSEIDNDSGIEDWISEILKSNDISTDDKLNGIYELLPEQYKFLVFESNIYEK